LEIKAMTLAETIYQHSLNLPEQAAREALDFIEFLEQRYAAQAKTDNEVERQEALAYLQTVRIDWNGKPIPNRDELYDDARGRNDGIS
jgi:hypothetical protein